MVAVDFSFNTGALIYVCESTFRVQGFSFLMAEPANSVPPHVTTHSAPHVVGGAVVYAEAPACPFFPRPHADFNVHRSEPHWAETEPGSVQGERALGRSIGNPRPPHRSRRFSFSHPFTHPPTSAPFSPAPRL